MTLKAKNQPVTAIKGPYLTHRIGWLRAAVFGAILPPLLVMIVPDSFIVWPVSWTSLLFFALLGGLAAQAGGANLWKSIIRVTFWSAQAMALTAGVGALFGAKV